MNRGANMGKTLIGNFKGVKGDSATIKIGNVTKGDEASVTNRGNESSAILDFVLPKGDKGENGNRNIYYGTCNTAAATAAKTATIDGFVLEEGSRVLLKMQTNNSASSPTLNINNTGAKPISVAGGTPNIYWSAGTVLEFVYDGTYWCLLKEGIGNAASYGITKLSDTYATKIANGAAANGIGASQNALYEAYNKLNTSSDTMSTKLKESMLAIPATTLLGTGGFNLNLLYQKGKNYVVKDGNGNGTLMLDAGIWIVFVKLRIPSGAFSAELALKSGADVYGSSIITNEQQEATFIFDLPVKAQFWLYIDCPVQGLTHYGDVRYSYFFVQKVFG